MSVSTPRRGSLQLQGPLSPWIPAHVQKVQEGRGLSPVSHSHAGLHTWVRARVGGKAAVTPAEAEAQCVRDPATALLGGGLKESRRVPPTRGTLPGDPWTR